MDHQKKRLAVVLLLSWITYNVAYLCRLNISTVLEKLSVGMGVSMEYLGAASSVYFVTYALGQLFNGLLGDRVHPYRFLILALTLTGGINIILSVQRSGAMFLVLWGLNGVCQSMFFGVMMRLLSFYAEEHQRKTASMLLSTCVTTGYLFSWVVLASLFEPYDYTPYFLVPGVIAVALTAAWSLFGKRHPFSVDAADEPPTPALRQEIREFAQDRLGYVCLFCGVVGAVQEGASFWLPMIFTDVLDLGENSILLLVLIPLARLVGLFLARWSLTVFKDDIRRAVIASMSGTCLLAAALVVTSRNVSWITVALIAALLTIVYIGNWLSISYYPLFFARRHEVSSLAGVLDFATYAGAAAMSGTLGILLARFGWPSLPVLWLGMSALGLLLAVTGAGACLRRKGARRIPN